MFRRKLYASISLLFALGIILSAGVGSVSAATSGGNGMRVSPVRTDLTINPGSSQTIDVYVTNLTNEPADLQGVVDDFTASPDESGTPDILLNGERAPTHSLQQYVSKIGSFTLGASQQKDVKVTISIPKGAAGGGYFGAVRFLPTSSNTNKNVSLTASVGSLVLVTVPGNVVEQMDLSSFDIRTVDPKTGAVGSPSTFFTSNKNLNGVARFENTGNLQEAPFGKIILKKGSTVLGSYEINNVSPPGNVLPGSIRRFTVPLTGLSSFGKYTLEGNFGYGTKGQLLSASTNFYIVPVSAIIIAVIVLVLIAVGIFFLRSYIRNAIRTGISRGSKK